MKVLFLFSLCSCLFLLPLAAESPVLEQGRAAEAAENYQRAIELYHQAMTADPTDPAPARALAELFTAKGLHDLALPVWREVVSRDPGDAESWISLAQTWSYLDNNQQSVTILDQALKQFPSDVEVTQALAWMLFKTENFRRGITLVEGFLAAHGTDRNLEMTLGTLYSSVFDYGLSRVHYLKSIDLAPGQRSEEKNFRSIAWYNLSLLEKSFYQFEKADQAIRQSLREEDRPAGALAWGELFQGRRDFAEARRLYEKAIEVDETPLGRFDLARLLQQFGFLDEAEAQLVQVEQHKDDTWIYNYGVTKDKLKRDLQELRSDLHQARFHSLDFSPRETPWDWGVWAIAKAREGLLWWYHDQTWKSLLVKLSESSLAVSNSPEAWDSLTLAHGDRPVLALKYLTLSRDHELPKNPKSKASYLIEEGVIKRDPALLEWALTLAQNPWENEDRERALATLIETRRNQGKASEVRSLLSQLFLLNPGGLPIRGWGLPVQFGVFGNDGERKSWKAALESFASQTGWDADSASRPGADWSLDVRAEAAEASWTLRDPEGNVVRSGVVRGGPGARLEAVAEIFRQIHNAFGSPGTKKEGEPSLRS
jgi:tetratricopeptide (TPR) repeat protein